MKDCIIPLFPLPSLMLYTFFTFLTQSEAIKMNNDLPGLCLFLSTNFELVVMNVLFSCHCSRFWTRPHLEVNLPSRRCSHPPRKHKTLLQSGSKSQRKFQHLITMEIEKQYHQKKEHRISILPFSHKFQTRLAKHIPN